MKSKTLCLAICLFTSLSQADAAIIASDLFSYANGNLAGNSGGAGWSTTWTNTEGIATVAEGQAIVAATPNQQQARVLSAGLSGDATIWIRFEAQQFTTLTGSTNSYGGLGLYNGTTEQVLIGKAWPGPYEWRAGTGGALVAPVVPVSTLSLTTVLAKITLNATGNDTLDVWLNPADLSSESTLGTAAISRSDADLSFDRVRLRAGSGAGGTESWQFDNLVLATTLGEVASVPEPSSALLGGIGLLALFRRRR